jgi:hypothetical protein
VKGKQTYEFPAVVSGPINKFKLNSTGDEPVNVRIQCSTAAKYQQVMISWQKGKSLLDAKLIYIDTPLLL